MHRNDIRIAAREGGEFDCYVVEPDMTDPVPAVVLASAVHGVDADIRQIADELASQGFFAAAPDLFWRTTPGPLPRTDKRTAARSEPRRQTIATGEADLADTLDALRRRPGCNGRAVVMGFCYGGPYAIIGPKRLGFEAGIACHGSSMLDFIADTTDLTRPVCLVWGDRDNRAPVDVLDAYRALCARSDNVEIHVFPGVQHGFMMQHDERFDAEARQFAMRRTVALLDALR
ncbi:MAG: dienelactone hydrolase family protein [Proteobacteria bacterium]|nr:dienelactone hydrolase family protein [Burkholderiales bacterium]